VFFFDFDEAVQAAASTGIYTCRKNGISCALVAQEKDGAKDPADILLNSGCETLQKKAKSFINDFDYLVAKALHNITASVGSGQPSAEEKAMALAFLFPYVDLLDSEAAKASCIEAAADTFRLVPALAADDYRRHVGKKGKTHTRQSGEKIGSVIRMNDELTLLIAVALDYVSSQGDAFFTRFRSTFEVNEIEDPNAKDIFIALEECIRYGETGMDEFLARVSSAELKKIIVERSATGEFSMKTEQLVSDGIMKFKGKRLEQRQKEIIVELRRIRKNDLDEDKNPEAKGLEVRELLAEKMRIDNELCLLKQGRQV
jgi:DNA primase